MAWTPELIKLFKDVKRCIDLSTIFARFNPSKIVFIKTDWIAEIIAFKK